MAIHFKQSLLLAINGLFTLRTRLQVRRIVRKESIKLDLGGGARKGDRGWTVVDFDFRADITYDLARGVPFPDSSVDEINTSHMLEHLEYPDIVRLLDECYRVLKIGGTLNVSVPSARLYIESYVRGENFRSASELRDCIGDYKTESLIDELNYIAYLRGEHKYMFDEENLVNLCCRAGFANASCRQFNPEIDTAHRRFESIYVNATKQ